MMELRRMLRIQIRIPGDKKRSGKTLTQAILDVCRKESILGATVVRCDFGFGEHEYKQHALRSLTDLPQIIEIIDEPDEIMHLLPALKDVVLADGLITIEEVLAV